MYDRKVRRDWMVAPAAFYNTVHAAHDISRIGYIGILEGAAPVGCGRGHE